MTTRIETAAAGQPHSPTYAPSSAALAGLWVLIAISSYVMIEPAPFDVIAVVLICAMLVGGLRIPRGLSVPLVLTGLLILANLISILFASESTTQPLPYMVFYAGLTVYLLVVWIFFASLVAADPVRVYRVIWHAWTFASVLAAVIGLAAYFRAIPEPELFMNAGRAKATFKDPNVYGPFLIPVALYILATLGRGGFLRDLLRGAVFLLLVFGLIVGFSRGAWGHFVLSLGVFAALSLATSRTLSQYFRFFAASACVIAVTAAIVVVALSTPETGEMFKKRAALVQYYDVEAGGRFATQRAALKRIAEQPLGIGPNRTLTELGRVAHNVYLKVAAENGWLGGIAFVAFIAVSLWRGLRFALTDHPLQREYMVVYATIVGIAAESVLIDTLHWRHLFLLLGMLWGPIVAGRIASANIDARLTRATPTAWPAGGLR